MMSGNALVGGKAKRLMRGAGVARLIELDPKYVDVIVRHLQDWTGKIAYREPDEALLDELAYASRLASSGEP
ncbi:hypothetical protein CJO94_01020 [Ralstonia solanacearum]|nr:hypothetical protein CJO94_01020 [Ralstonia solanacearum]